MTAATMSAGLFTTAPLGTTLPPISLPLPPELTAILATGGLYGTSDASASALPAQDVSAFFITPGAASATLPLVGLPPQAAGAPPPPPPGYGGFIPLMTGSKPAYSTGYGNAGNRGNNTDRQGGIPNSTTQL
uniref:Uncharacterized protein n=1 Tax=Oryza rufipogon TaxID=4529 RepID=A0A0E0NBL8_ORYRU